MSSAPEPPSFGLPAEAAAALKRKASPKGCLLGLAGGWLLWLLVDLTRLGAFRGDQDLLGFVFSAPSAFIPLLILAVGTPSLVQYGLRERRKREFPDEPWMWDRRWNRAGARALRSAGESSRSLAPALMATAFLALAVFAYVFVFSPEDRPPAFIVIPVVLFALGTWGVHLARGASRLKFGGSFLRYRAFPFFLGERLSATLEGIDRLKGFTRLTLTLRCARETVVGSGKQRRVEREVLYEEPKEVSPDEVLFGTGDAAGVFQLVRRVDPGAALPITFELPEADLGSHLYDFPKRKWELAVEAEVPGVDYRETFLVPVYPAPRKGGPAADRESPPGDGA